MDRERLAQDAASLLENETLKLALSTIEAEAIEHMIWAPDAIKRRECADKVKSIRSLRTRLELWRSDVPRQKVQVV